MTTLAKDPVATTPVFAAGPDKEGVPKKVQSLHSTFASSIRKDVPLPTNKQLLKPYAEFDIPPIPLIPTRKLYT